MQRTPLIALLAVVALVGVGAAAAAPQATLGSDSYETTQNSTVTTTIDVTDTDTATLRVGGNSVGYVLHATVTDENGDGTVTAEFDVSNAGTEDTTLSAVGDDAVTVEVETSLSDPPLTAGAYNVAVLVDGQQTDLASLQVTESKQATDRTTDEPTTNEPTTDATETPTTEKPTTSGSSGGSAPGFGAAAALAAVLGATAVTVRR